MFTVYIKCEFNVKVQLNQIMKGTIQIIEMGLTLDKEKSRYLLNIDKSKILGENAFNKEKGTYSLHALIVENNGSSEEFVSNALNANGVSPLTLGKGIVQSVELESGKYKHEVCGSQGATVYYSSSEYIRTGGKGGYSVGTINLQSKTKTVHLRWRERCS